MAQIGHLVGVKTPVMDSLITLAATANGIDYRRQGLTLDKMGLSGVPAENLPEILQNGF
jgi:opine dehydrogenase